MVRERSRFAARRVKAKPPSKSLRQQRVSSRPKKHRAAAEPVRPLQVGGRSLLRNVGVNQDVTERRKAGRALRESEERLHLALETAELGMWEWQPDTDSFYFDERECRLLGMTSATAPKSSARPQEGHSEPASRLPGKFGCDCRTEPIVGCRVPVASCATYQEKSRSSAASPWTSPIGANLRNSSGWRKKWKRSDSLPGEWR